MLKNASQFGIQLNSFLNLYQLYPSGLNAESFPNIFTRLRKIPCFTNATFAPNYASTSHYASGTQSTFLLDEFRYPAAEHRLGEGRQLLNSS